MIEANLKMLRNTRFHLYNILKRGNYDDSKKILFKKTEIKTQTQIKNYGQQGRTEGMNWKVGIDIYIYIYICIYTHTHTVLIFYIK